MYENHKIGRVELDSSPTWDAMYDPTELWNGWLCPMLDRANVTSVMEFMNGLGGDDGHFEWDGDTIVMTVDWGEKYGGVTEDRIHPIEHHGRKWWPLGAYGWVWSGADDPPAPYVLVDDQGRPYGRMSTREPLGPVEAPFAYTYDTLTAARDRAVMTGTRVISMDELLEGDR